MRHDREINRLVEELAEAWNAKDTVKFSLLFTSDGEWTDVTGHRMAGREVIETEHRFPFTTLLKNAILTVQPPRLTAIHPDIVSAEVRWSSSGQTSYDGQPLPDRNGIMHLITTREAASWVIKLGYNFDYTQTYGREGSTVIIRNQPSRGDNG